MGRVGVGRKGSEPGPREWGGEESREDRRVVKVHSLPSVNSIPFTIYQVPTLCQALCWALGEETGQETWTRICKAMNGPTRGFGLDPIVGKGEPLKNFKQVCDRTRFVF